MSRFLDALQPGDTGIVLGDFGFLYRDSAEENRYLDDLSDACGAKGAELAFLLGNHENFDVYDSDRFPISERYGGRIQSVREYVLCLQHGEIYTLEDRTYCVFGGGHSLDKIQRLLSEHVDGVCRWWPQEMPTERDYRNAERNLLAHGNRVDYFLTHSCPLGLMERLRLQCGRQQSIKDDPEELPLQLKLEEYACGNDFRVWYFGHFHVDVTLGNFFSSYGAGKTFRGLLDDIVTAE